MGREPTAGAAGGLGRGGAGLSAQRGFTVVEFLIVLLILGLVVGVIALIVEGMDAGATGPPLIEGTGTWQR